MSKLKEIRLKRKLRQKDIADKLNITREAVSQWENGKNFPARKRLLKLAKFLKCKPIDLL